MGKQLFIPRTLSGSDTDYDPADLAAGEIAFVTTSGANLVAKSLAQITDNITPFQIMWRKANTSDVIECTPVLTLGELVKSTILSSDSGNAQHTTINCTVPTTTAIGDTYTVKVVNTTPGTANLTKKTFEYVATSASYAGSDIVNHFLTDISTDTDLQCYVSDTDTSDLRIVGTGTTNHFRAAVDNNVGVDWTITYTSDAKPSTLYYAQITDLETKMKSHGEGITNTIWFAKPYTSEVPSVTSFYKMGIYDFKLRKSAKHGMSAVDYENYTLYLAEPSDIDLNDDLSAKLIAFND